MIHYPLSFNVDVSELRGASQTWKSRASQTQDLGALECAIPPEFEGPGGGFSPEDFFALAVANCFGATFQVIAHKSSVTFEGASVSARLTVDRDDSGRPWMKHVLLKASVRAGGSNPERIRRVLSKTSQSCLVVHSVKTHVEFEFEVI